MLATYRECRSNNECPGCALSAVPPDNLLSPALNLGEGPSKQSPPGKPILRDEDKVASNSCHFCIHRRWLQLLSFHSQTSHKSLLPRIFTERENHSLIDPQSTCNYNPSLRNKRFSFTLEKINPFIRIKHSQYICFVKYIQTTRTNRLSWAIIEQFLRRDLSV